MDVCILHWSKWTNPETWHIRYQYSKKPSCQPWVMAPNSRVAENAFSPLPWMLVNIYVPFFSLSPILGLPLLYLTQSQRGQSLIHEFWACESKKDSEGIWLLEHFFYLIQHKNFSSVLVLKHCPLCLNPSLPHVLWGSAVQLNKRMKWKGRKGSFGVVQRGRGPTAWKVVWRKPEWWLSLFKSECSIWMWIQGTINGLSPTAQSVRCVTYERMKHKTMWY